MSANSSRSRLSEALASARVRAGRGESIETALADELDRRDLTLSPDKFDLVIRAYHHPNSTMIDMIRSNLRNLRLAAKTISGLSETAQPAWTALPRHVRRMHWRADQEEVEVVIPLHDVPQPNPTLDRLICELPHSGDRVRDRNEVRPFTCWMSDTTGPITVRVGRYVLSEMPVDHRPLAASVISAHGGEHGAVDLVAELLGQGVDDGRVRLILPDRA